MRIRRPQCNPSSLFGILLEVALAAIVSLSLASTCSAGCSAGPWPGPQTTAAITASDYATRDNVAGVRNFAKVSEHIYRGYQPSQKGFENLAKMGIEIDVDLRLSGKGREEKRVTALGMRYVSIPWFCMRPKDEDFAKFLQLIRDNPNKKIFVHCRTGNDRVGMMIAAYRMAEQGWSAKDASKEMHALGATWLHRRVCTGLGRYESQFPERFRTKPAFSDLRKAKSAAASATSSPG